MVTQLITSAFALANSRHSELRQVWVRISLRTGALLPNFLLLESVQRAGDLDILLRSLEDEFSKSGQRDDGAGLLSTTYQVFLSEHWIGVAYEIFGALKARKLLVDDAFNGIARDLKHT
jgi:hypothetical protein